MEINYFTRNRAPVWSDSNGSRSLKNHRSFLGVDNGYRLIFHNEISLFK